MDRHRISHRPAPPRGAGRRDQRDRVLAVPRPRRPPPRRACGRRAGARRGGAPPGGVLRP
nr:hypothetical protein [Nocardioides convexus]